MLDYANKIIRAAAAFRARQLIRTNRASPAPSLLDISKLLAPYILECNLD